MQRTPLRDETVSKGEDLDALLSNLQNDSDVLTIAIQTYEEIQAAGDARRQSGLSALRRWS
tara:strand:- start:137 stop:319 length:183 start_codon:yes stop_codon:yes gene_type:complete